MKKLIIFLLLLCSSFFSFSQKEITNESHPFQVLFVDSAFNIGTQEPLKPFDFIGKYDLINNIGELVLLHYSGEVFETRNGILNIRKIVNEIAIDKNIKRPLISNSFGIFKKSITEINSAGSSSYCMNKSNTIELNYPFYSEQHLNRIRKSNSVLFKWHFTDVLPKDYRYIIQVTNLFDSVLLTKQTILNSIILDISKVDLEEGIMVLSIVQQKMDEEFDLYMTEEFSDFGFLFFDETQKGNHYSQSKYNFIVDALIANQKEMYELSNMLFKMSIEESNQDSRFIKLYEDFLERNPHFK